MSDKKLNIAFDLDGVIFDFMGYMLQVLNYRHSKLITKEDCLEYTPTNKNGHPDTHISNQEWATTFRWFEDAGGYASLNPLEHAVEVINRLYDAGHNIYLVTARNSAFRKSTELCLILNKVRYHKLHMTTKGKGPILKKLEIDLFVDDHPNNVMDALKVGITDSILMTAPFNVQWENSVMGVDRVNNMVEVERIVEALVNDKK